ncbi:MAG: hypothetical protein A2W93_14185 [Bacteroidetes bacterium GWF2_43_63]|nr:MAG: hypothetical protein A2W94_00755 [Bacteroidetes bacterium GWE2_42_42]OFY52490.1 MAG: hypothetical protein A2W93_14185 [Bacteroidetes bacterium GWF2_43_63]HBG71397.1 hypothetical protein [Bacteroidales bacterium]HCB60851.1 hypothetical protein [Bacteroidales bacterium]HCY23424.1 hypothetical protein [Bacteroidales bacterium]
MIYLDKIKKIRIRNIDWSGPRDDISTGFNLAFKRPGSNLWTIYDFHIRMEAMMDTWFTLRTTYWVEVSRDGDGGEVWDNNGCWAQSLRRAKRQAVREINRMIKELR